MSVSKTIHKIHFAVSFLALASLTMNCKNDVHKDSLNQKLVRQSDSLTCDDLDRVPEWLNVLADQALPQDDINIWVPTGDFQRSSLVRFPRFVRRFDEADIKRQPLLKNFQITKLLSHGDTLKLTSVLNEQASGQIIVASKKQLTKLKVKAISFKSEKGDVISQSNVRIRFVQYLPVQRSASEFSWSARYENVVGEEVSGLMSPNVVGDPLIDLPYVNVPAYRAQSIWFTFKTPSNAVPGTYYGQLALTMNEHDSISFMVSWQVLDHRLPNTSEFQFYQELWVNPYAISSQYHVTAWSPEHWKILKEYFADLYSRNVKSVTTTIVENPWQIPWLNNSTRSQTKNEYESMIKWILTKSGSWKFDYSVFDNYVEFAFAEGLDERINAYSMNSFKGDERISFFNESTLKDEIRIVELNSKEYIDVWKIFLSDFKQHLLKKGWYKKTFLCFDESSVESLKSSLNVIRLSAPEFLDRITISGSPDVSDLASNLSISFEFFPGQNLAKEITIPTINSRSKHKKLTSFYLCGQPEHPNMLSYSPAVESQMIPWLALKYNVNGYQRWSYCNWTDDPFKNPVFYYNQGDEYLIYPGKSGPVSSIRWELLKEGIEDYELFLQARAKSKSEDVTQLKIAIELATRNVDGRKKDLQDMATAREIIINILNQR